MPWSDQGILKMKHLVPKRNEHGKWGLWNTAQKCWVMKDQAPFFENEDECRKHWNGIMAGGFGGAIG